MNLEETNSPQGTCNDFEKTLYASKLFPLLATGVDTVQINMGKLCNQSCKHCHVQAGPDRTEIMGKEVLSRCLELITQNSITTVELTGGAPELNPSFRSFVGDCSKTGVHITVRSNLTVMLEDECTDIPVFLKDHGVEIVGSLPCYTEENVDRQRGAGTYGKSVKVLKILNDIGYGASGSGLVLNLVYNPGGAFLPGDQKSLEHDYKRELKDRFGIVFNRLYTITNMPIGRFKMSLERSGDYKNYINLLIEAFNPEAAQQVMCRNLISIGWDGSVYDCDFNQMLGMRCNHGAPYHISRYNRELMSGRRIVTGIHCYGCTAGAGSSCTGALD